MIEKLNLYDTAIAREIKELQRASYQIEADLIGYPEIPTLKDTIETIRESGEIFYGYYRKDKIAGIISYKYYNEILDLHRVAVHPNYFNQGIAGQLLMFIETAEKDIKKIVVCTGKMNFPAVNLYAKYGYKKIKDFCIDKDVFMTEFEKDIINNL
jgi:ribosomal protein S18 acetylase RimI-like enzyme